jgi:hypothetical protein
MMLKFICLLFLFLNLSVRAQVQLESFYFADGDTTLTDESSLKYFKLNEMQNTKILQIIELDAFSNVGRSGPKNRALAETRIAYFIRNLNQEPQDITILNYGGERIALNFTPKSWNRIDIYYYLGPKRDTTVLVVPADTVPVIIPKDTIPLPIVELPKIEKIKLHVPIVTPIAFKGGKTKIDESSFKYIDSLYIILVQNPEISAHIRGHVCCEPKVRKSRKRAKSVYKSLVEKGLEESRLSYNGYGNSMPVITPERTEADRKQNRRVDIIFK